MYSGSVNLRVFRLNYTANIPEKILGMSRIMISNRRELLCQKKLGEKLSVKDGDFLTYLLTKNGFVKIKKLEFDLSKAIKQIEKLKRQKLLLS